ncbi:MAG: 2-hydroxyacid dehydrogenase [Gammaproteobacteria bacterium]|nr:MAG: 2-hydroxyacid dehydrogenase [Gammaproteobacteria bacterium]
MPLLLDNRGDIEKLKLAIFSTKPYDREFLEQENAEFGYELVFFETRLSSETRLLAQDFPAVSVFVNDDIDRAVLAALAEGQTRLIALRCAGFNNVDLAAARELGIKVVRVPAYSPFSVAEHTAGLMLTLNRKIHRAYQRVKEGNFSLDGLMGSEFHGKTVGIIGLGRIGLETARILKGFGMRILACDPQPNPAASEIGIQFVELAEIYQQSDVISLHCPLTPETHHLINSRALNEMKKGVMLINTSRGAVVDTKAVICELKRKKLGALGLDVYEQEGDLFFEDLSNEIIQDDIFERLLTFPNVVITGHQGFFTEQAMQSIASTTLGNVRQFEEGEELENEVSV